jgi:beta-glucosidase
MTVQFGATSVAASIEGLTPAADAFAWQKAGRLPGSADGNGFGTRFRDDFELFAAHGLSTVTIGIEWARIEPQPGKIDGAAIEHYATILQAARQFGVSTWVSLHHRTVPGWFVDEGGFLDDKNRGYAWPRYVDIVAGELGALVDAWVPLQDLSGYANAAYGRGVHPPGQRDPEARAKALRGIWLAWRDSWRLLRGTGAPVVHSLALAPVYTTDGTVEGSQRARRADDNTWQLAVSAIRDGELCVPGLASIEVPDLQDSGDIVGITYPGALAASVEGMATYPLDGRRGQDGMAVWAEGLALTLHRLAEMLPQRRLAITGYGAPTSDAPWQADEARAARSVVLAAAGDGIPIEMALWSTAVDGWAYDYGFDLNAGLFDRDRNPRPALAAWLGHD